MKKNVVFVIKLFIRFILHIFWLCPVRKKTFFFMSDRGLHYSCNPKYLYEWLQLDKRFSDAKYVWCFNDNNMDGFIRLSSNTKIIFKNNPIVYIFHLLSSQVVISNSGGFSFVPMRKSQLVIETWHGGGVFKKVGLRNNNSCWLSEQEIKLAMKNVNLFLATSQKNTEYFIRKSMNYSGHVLQSGFPRNDIFFQESVDIENIKDRVREKLGIKKKPKVVLYAPTFRGDYSRAVAIDAQYETINPNTTKAALQKRFEGEWIFLTRGHYHIKNYAEVCGDYDVSDYPDMQELLLITDVLITDYSSSIWDNALQKKPSFLYVPDLMYYQQKDRGFEVSVETWPAIVAKSNDELVKQILSFNPEEYLKKVGAYLEDVNSHEFGDARVKVADYIFNRIYA